MDGSRSCVDRSLRQSGGPEAPQQSRQPVNKSAVTKTSGVRPNAQVGAAHERVAKLERALSAMEGPEVESLRVALRRAREATQGLHVDVQVKQCEGFLTRARANLAELDAKRVDVTTNIQRLEMLESTTTIAAASARRSLRSVAFAGTGSRVASEIAASSADGSSLRGVGAGGFWRPRCVMRPERETNVSRGERGAQ